MGIRTALVIYLMRGPGVNLVLILVKVLASHVVACCIVFLWFPSRVMYTPSIRNRSFGDLMSWIGTFPIWKVVSMLSAA